MRTLALLLIFATPTWADTPAETSRELTPVADRAAFELAEETRSALEALRIRVPIEADQAAWHKMVSEGMRQQAIAVDQLRERWETLSAQMHPSYAVPAMVRTAEVLEQYAADLQTLPVPVGMSQDRVAGLKMGLIEGSAALRQSARSQYLGAVIRAEATGVKGEWVDFARDRIARLRLATDAIAEN